MKVKKIPERKCVGCQEMKPKKELVRIVRTPEGEVLVDSTGKKNGRGAYICPNLECLKKAVKGKRLDRALSVTIPPELISQLEQELAACETDG
ncbi:MULTISPECIES: RNase P modulator RnpM [Carboxydocella]|uniref:YlxR domain-containing protein n=2 Tax=Carboxydocella TaxID=178898 RepID=A0A1T4P6U3_9FIRM|nr:MULTISPECIES: YlxR family protein [Carboxydocella]AVX20722.1 hypothetical protein CFE_1544 [Carboxydocella thermautotrophica]AVX31141.1 hypothetical protein CTH_1562 [Carboxydocella thermautotrophica]GAW30716.1 hypothetical protein JDF658_04810 [Carboxydocella sp. JDF658]SJZ87179.1 hypothetical protein SAMN02745885_01163 [Carboxydocella sporoproducens DSM 16521]